MCAFYSETNSTNPYTFVKGFTYNIPLYFIINYNNSFAFYSCIIKILKHISKIRLGQKGAFSEKLSRLVERKR